MQTARLFFKILHIWKPIKKRLIHHSKAICPKVNFSDELWRPSCIYADYESCPKLLSWQQSWICSMTPYYESPKKFIAQRITRLVYWTYRSVKSTINTNLEFGCGGLIPKDGSYNTTSVKGKLKPRCFFFAVVSFGFRMGWCLVFLFSCQC